MLGVTNIPFDEIGALSTGTTVEADAVSAQSHTITSGKKVVILQNVGSKLVWFGGSDVDPANSKGNILLPRVMLIFRNAKSNFKIYFKCVAGDTTNIGIVEAD